MSRPNILLLHCHDVGRHLGCYGVPTVATPHLDALAGQGIRATGMFAAAPQCSPSRSAMFTGRWPHANGVLGLTHSHFGWDLHPQERHLASRLRDAGYRTRLVGVHHESRVLPDEQIAERLGFDLVQTGGIADVVADRAVAALHDHHDRAGGAPFYLQVGFAEPHRAPGDRDEPGVMGFLGNHVEPDDSRGVTVPPYLVDDESARIEIAELQGAIRQMDGGVGRVLSELDALGLTDDTITIFTTDHGVALPRAKCSLYDPGIEIAFLARWPGGGWTGGHDLDGLLGNVDIVPTLLDAIGLDAAGPLPLHGRSFAARLGGVDGERRQETFAEMTYHDYYDPRRCIRTDRWKLIANFSSAPGFMDPSQAWVRRCTPLEPSYPHDAYHPDLELYDLTADPLERDDLAQDEAYATVRADLAGRLWTWMRETGDPILDGAVTSPQHSAAIAALRRG